ncbi:MAG TPA: aminodeoxychorismate synthase component I [Maritimibacter sp.]|nr:aminodeoxychorismate synthase component I [Maritimibacter sp.]
MPQVRFDHGPGGVAAQFDTPKRIITAWTPDEMSDAFAAMEAARGAGHWLAGLASYELGYALIPRLAARMPEDRRVPLLQFGVFDAPGTAPPLSAGTANLTDVSPVWTAGRYDEAFRVVHDFIAAGDIYQANLTFPMTARLDGTPSGLYARLSQRQPVPHGAYLDLGGPVILSRSPELFFRLDADRTLTTRPMKGTAPRGKTRGLDVARRLELAASEKNQAENLMIVDLLRNDMSRVSELGSVRVPELFRIETYETLHQMTSRVTSLAVPDLSISTLFEALFPCGSVTGAPKIRAMEIISDVEPGPRGAYCGSLGWIAPDGSMSFNVAIRTLTCFPDGAVTFGVGGGVVYDSTSASEYEEALLKAAFADLPDLAVT